MADSLRSKDRGVTGPLEPLPENVFPTNLQVMRWMQMIKESLVAEEKKVPLLTEIAKPAISELCKIWKKASIPTIRDRGIERALLKVWEQGRQVTKNATNRQTWEEQKDQLFDISSCKCLRIECSEWRKCSGSCEEVHIDCMCKSRVPARELSFLFDQRR